MKRSAKDNRNLSEYVRNKIVVDRFGTMFSELLIEAFVRMQDVLNLSPDEFEEDINNFINSTWQIRFGNLPENVAGWSDPNNHEIVFNEAYWKHMNEICSPEEFVESFFETFVHEVLHGMQLSRDTQGYLCNRAEGYNKKTKNRAHAIYEICTQAIAAKTARSRKYEDFENGKILSGDGYADEIFAVALIASTFGVSEQEVLKYGVRERNKLIAVLNKNIGNYEYTEQLLNQIEDELEIIHSIGYPDDNQKEFKKMSNEEKRQAKTDSILKLVNLCQEGFSKRIENIPLDITNKEITVLKFDQKKMLDTLGDEFRTYGYGLKGDYNQMYFAATELGQNAGYIKRALNALSDVAKDKTGKFYDARIQIVNIVKRRNLDYLSNYGIEVERGVTQYLANNDVEMKSKKIYTDYNSLIEWDNSYIENVIFGRTTELVRKKPELYLQNWNEERLNSAEGINKFNALKIAARKTAQVHGGNDIRYILYKLLRTDISRFPEVYQNITRTDGARDAFQKEFCTDVDKEYLTKLIAQRYIDKIYDFRTNMPREVVCMDSVEETVRVSILPTIQKYGREQAMWAISKTILEGNYDSISGEVSKKNMQLISPEAFLDSVSSPLMNELMQKREIPKNVKDAVVYSMHQTGQKYPGTVGTRLAMLIADYQNTGRPNFNHFTSNGRNGLIQNIRTPSDIEAMIGIICNDFGEQAEAKQFAQNPAQNEIQNFLNNVAVTMGTDAFREAMIRATIYRDYSLFKPVVAQRLNFFGNEGIFSCLTYPTLLKAYQMQVVHYENTNGLNYVSAVSVNDLRENARQSEPSLIDKWLDNLKNEFGIKPKDKNIGTSDGR